MPLIGALASTIGRQLLQKGTAAISSRLVGRGTVALATVAAGTAIGNRLTRPGRAGAEDVGPSRRRRRGLSGRDIQGAQRVAALVRAFGYKPKTAMKKKRR